MERTHWLPGREDSIAAADCMLEQDGVVEVDLPTAEQLVSESPVEPLGRCGPYQSGAAYVSSVLQSVRRLPDPVGFQNSAAGLDLGFYAARSYSLRRPPRTGRRLIRSRERSATG